MNSIKALFRFLVYAVRCFTARTREIVREIEYAKRIAEAERLEKDERLEEAKRLAEAKRLEEDERLEETKRLEEDERLEEAKRMAEAKRLEEAERLEETKRLEEAKRIREAEQREDAHRLEEAKRIEVAQAQFELGEIYYEGQGVKRDYKKAFEWFQKAAEQGNAQAQYNLSLMYAKGRGVPKDEFKTVLWCQKSAEQGNAQAQYNLGLMYAQGWGVPKDIFKATLWRQKSAEQGYLPSQKILGPISYIVDGVVRDSQKGDALLSASDEQGHREAIGLITKYSINKARPQHEENIVKKLLICDVEGTIFTAKYKIEEVDYSSSMWQPLARCLGDAGVAREVALAYKWERGEFKTSYIDWVFQSFLFHKSLGLKQSDFNRILNEATYMPGVVDFFENLDKSRYLPVLISGGFQELVDRAKAELGIKHGHGACAYIFDEQTGLLKDCRIAACDFDGKIDYMRRALREYDLDEDVVPPKSQATFLSCWALNSRGLL